MILIRETATELKEKGIITPEDSDEEFARKVIEYQLKKEERAEKYAESNPEKYVIVCDRSAIEPSAYIGVPKVREILSRLGRNFEQIRDSYDLVLHLVTAAKGANKFYTLGNNPARDENIAQAIEIDDKMLQIWKDHRNRIIIDNSGKDFEEKLEKIDSAVESHIEKRADRLNNEENITNKEKSDDTER